MRPKDRASSVINLTMNRYSQNFHCIFTMLAMASGLLLWSCGQPSTSLEPPSTTVAPAPTQPTAGSEVFTSVGDDAYLDAGPSRFLLFLRAAA
jgi:hypothetical protein